MKKWIVFVLIAVLITPVVYGIYSSDGTNARVLEEIRKNPQGQLAQRTMSVTLADGRTLPVNYLREDRLVFIGIDGLWWREFVGDGQLVKMLIQGETLCGRAIAALNDPEYTAHIFSRLRPKVPSWLPDWLNGKLVVITVLDAA
jgi:hypothetical protein